MAVAIVTGSAGLIGSEAVRFLSNKGLDVFGVDNDMRGYFFGSDASTHWNRVQLEKDIPTYRHYDVDVRDTDSINQLFRTVGRSVALIIHTAAQPSHDWAASEPSTDFTINANGTLSLLEATRRFCPEAVFVFTSTNKVYGDTPNRLPLIEKPTRWELEGGHRYYQGIDESMDIDQSKHSLFGVSKLAADLLVQEYGRYFGIHTGCFRGGCLTGPSHSGARLHGFLSYLMKCAIADSKYTVYGYKGKQVRDNIHSIDLINALWCFFQAPRAGEVYNIGGGRHSNCSVLEAISTCEQITGKSMRWTYSDTNRIGDHIWWISSCAKFERHYPSWRRQHDIRAILEQICEATAGRLTTPKAVYSLPTRSAYGS